MHFKQPAPQQNNRGHDKDPDVWDPPTPPSNQGRKNQWGNKPAKKAQPKKEVPNYGAQFQPNIKGVKVPAPQKNQGGNKKQ